MPKRKVKICLVGRGHRHFRLRTRKEIKFFENYKMRVAGMKRIQVKRAAKKIRESRKYWSKRSSFMSHYIVNKRVIYK